MSGELAGRVALVTGSSRGIGRGIAVELGRAGAAVAINYRRGADEAQAAVAEIEAAGGRAQAFQGSVDAPAELEALVAGVRRDLGDVDLLVANAGIASRGQLVADTDPAEVQRLLAVHALSAHRLAQLLLPGMRRAPRADVIVISSSELTAMRAGGASYNMAKAALEAFALTLAHEEAGNGVRVNIVAPGLVATDMGDKLVKAKLGLGGVAELDAGQPFGRVTRPRDVGRAVVFLAGEGAGQITGQRLVIDGGADASPTGGGS
jgi:NAD(P)-dependent dehydrogenase (short-subunit alcohol dehydrogenase family)